MTFSISLDFSLTAGVHLALLGTLVIPNRILRLGTGRQPSARHIGRHLDGVLVLHLAADVVVVPDLVELGAAVVEGALSSLGLVVPRAAAADKGDVAEAVGQGGLDVRKRVRGGVGGPDIGRREPGPGGQCLEVGNRRLEELKEVCVLGCLGALYVLSPS